MEEPLDREEQAIRASERQLHRFEWYTAGSVYVVIVFFAFMGVVAGAVRAPDDPGLIAVVAVVVGAHSVVTLWITHTLFFGGKGLGSRTVGGRIPGGPAMVQRHLGPRAAAGYAAFTVATILVGAWAVHPGPEPSGALPVPTWVSFNALLVVGLLAGWRRWVPIGVVAGAVTAAALLLVGVQAPLVTAVAIGVVALAWVGGACGQCSAWTVDVVRQLHDSRVAQAHLAVAEERMRFSRDLHDVSGRTLSTIGVKSQLAAELARRADPRAVDEMLAVHALADEALADMRGLVRGYRMIDPLTELAGARSLLRSAGITVGADDLAPIVAKLTPAGREALGWFIREGATNVLRHSDARAVTARVVAHARAERVLIVLANDQPRAVPTEPGAPCGHGLTGLGERFARAGGRLESGLEGDRFVLRAQLPLGKHACTDGSSRGPDADDLDPAGADEPTASSAGQTRRRAGRR